METIKTILATFSVLLTTENTQSFFKHAKQIVIKNLIILLFTFSSISLYAQEYVSFPTENAIWNEVKINQQPYDIKTIQYGILGDTLINNISYKKIFVLNDTVYPLSSEYYCGAIRETGKKIFVTNSNCVNSTGTGDGEVVLYDFTKQVGDTVFVGENGMGSIGYLIIDHFDSISINNQYRKTIHFTMQDDFWIEGIGSTRGLFSPINLQTTRGSSYELVCFNELNTVLYLNPAYNTCFPVISNTISQSFDESNFEIHQNINEGYTDIVFSDRYTNQYNTFELFDIMGNLTKSIEIDNNQNIRIIHSQLPESLYIYIYYGIVMGIINQENYY